MTRADQLHTFEEKSLNSGDYGSRRSLRPQSLWHGRHSTTSRWLENLVLPHWLRLAFCCLLACWAGCFQSESAVQRTSTDTKMPGLQEESVDLGDDPEVASGQVTPVPAAETMDESRPPAEEVRSLRPPDLRADYDSADLQEHQIQRYESPRLRLYTDIPTERAQPLLPLVDALFEEWESYFGPLPAARDGSSYQLSAFVMKNQQRFRDAGLLPGDLEVFAHGKHRGQEFWMNDQESGYYLRHLLLHEATHCFMEAMGGTTIEVPLWYLEGMAELFATHKIGGGGKPAFRIMPESSEDVVGFGRVEMMELDLRQSKAPTLPQLGATNASDFLQRQSLYAWSWAVCQLADHHPRYRLRFQELGRRYPVEGFEQVWEELFHPLMSDFAVEWLLLTRELEYGHDFVEAAIEFRDGKSLPPAADGGLTCSIRAKAGWQSSGVRVEAGKHYRVEASGQVILGHDPAPWTAEPEGITARYVRGRPIGQLLGLVIGDQPADLNGSRFVGTGIPIGSASQFSSPENGTLYLRVNEASNELEDNQGAFHVRIRPADRKSVTE